MIPITVTDVCHLCHLSLALINVERVSFFLMYTYLALQNYKEADKTLDTFVTGTCKMVFHWLSATIED